MPNSLVAPLVGVLQAGLQEVEAGPEAGQHQDRHQQVEGHEPVQEHPRHAEDAAGGRREGGGEGTGQEGKGWRGGEIGRASCRERV